MTLQFSLGETGCADLIDPKFPHNDVVNRRCDFAPHVVVSARVEEQMNVSLNGRNNVTMLSFKSPIISIAPR